MNRPRPPELAVPAARIEDDLPRIVEELAGFRGLAAAQGRNPRARPLLATPE
jgi:hypothetical protein